MRSTIIPMALAANLVSAAGLHPRYQASDPAAFNSAADDLISNYIPVSEWAALTSAVGSAVSAAGITQDAKDAIFSALKATEAPAWFASVVPTAYSSQYAALESAIDDLRPTVTVTVPRPVTTVIGVTTVDENGSTIVASVTTTVVPTPTTITTDVVPTPSVSVVTGTDSEGNSYTSTFAGAGSTTASGSADTTATATATETVTTEATATESATATETETGADASGTDASGTASGTAASGTEAPNVAPTAMAHGLAGVAAVVGLVLAL